MCLLSSPCHTEGTVLSTNQQTVCSSNTLAGTLSGETSTAQSRSHTRLAVERPHCRLKRPAPCGERCHISWSGGGGCIRPRHQPGATEGPFLAWCFSQMFPISRQYMVACIFSVFEQLENRLEKNKAATVSVEFPCHPNTDEVRQQPSFLPLLQTIGRLYIDTNIVVIEDT